MFFNVQQGATRKTKPDCTEVYGERVYCSPDLRSADTPDEFTVRVAGFRSDRMKNEARLGKLIPPETRTVRCVRTTCTKPHTDIVLLQMFAQRASEVTAVSQAVCGLLIIFKAFVGFFFVSRYKASFELRLFRKSVLLFSHSCRLNISWNVVFLEEETPRGRWFDSLLCFHSGQRETRPLAPRQ